MADRKRNVGLAMLASAGVAGAAWVRGRRRSGSGGPSWSGTKPGSGAGEVSMADMTRKLAERQEPTPARSGSIAWAPGDGQANGMSQNDSMSGQPLDSRMMQQGHQPAQGTDGGHAAGVNVDVEGQPEPTASDEAEER